MALFDWDNDGDKDIFDDSFEYYLFNSHRKKDKNNSCSDEEALGCLGIIFAPILLLFVLSMIFDMFS